jgi:hypothetical protein
MRGRGETTTCRSDGDGARGIPEGVGLVWGLGASRRLRFSCWGGARPALCSLDSTERALAWGDGSTRPERQRASERGRGGDVGRLGSASCCCAESSLLLLLAAALPNCSSAFCLSCAAVHRKFVRYLANLSVKFYFIVFKNDMSLKIF